MKLPVNKVLLNHFMHSRLEIENGDPSFGKLSTSLAFTDPGTVLDHFLVVYFIRKHFFPGEMGPDSAERAGFRLYFRKCARGPFPGLAEKNPRNRFLTRLFLF